MDSPFIPFASEYTRNFFSAARPLLVLYGSMLRTIRLTSAADCVGRNGPCCGEPIWRSFVYFSTILCGSPVIITPSAFTIVISSPERSFFAVCEASLPSIAFFPSNTIIINPFLFQKEGLYHFPKKRKWPGLVFEYYFFTIT